jgi:sterol desaturase/sphingolipid hydroxylase (fatty acid hydroxylase superfamily)
MLLKKLMSSLRGLNPWQWVLLLGIPLFYFNFVDLNYTGIVRSAFHSATRFPVLTSSGVLYWPFLLIFSLLALTAYLFVYKQRGIRGFISFAFSRKVYLHPSSLMDYKLFVGNLFLTPLIIGVISLKTGPITLSVFIDYAKSSCAALLGGLQAPIDLPYWAQALIVLGGFTVMDFSSFFMHLLQHKVPFIWEFHKVHHSALAMNPATFIRSHPIAGVYKMVMFFAFLGTYVGVLQYFHGEGVFVLAGAGAGVWRVAVWGTGGIRHSHIWLPFPHSVSKFFLSPAQHQIHHSVDPRHVDKNLGNILAVWDRLLKNLYIPKEREDLTFGIVDFNDHSNLVSAYTLPVVASVGHLKNALLGLLRLASFQREKQPIAPPPGD